MLKKEHQSTVFENRILKRIFGSEKEENRETRENYIVRSSIICVLTR
jgi:hypothetical protein